MDDQIQPLTYSDVFLRDILRSVKTIALVGASDKPARPSYQVLSYLIAHDYRVIGVNPQLAGKSICSAPVAASLAEIAQPIDMVDVFRNSEAAGAVVDEALALEPKPRVIWMQLDVRNDAAAARAEAQGVKVVMDRCPKIEYERLLAGAVEPKKAKAAPKTPRRPAANRPSAPAPKPAREQPPSPGRSSRKPGAAVLPKAGRREEE